MDAVPRQFALADVGQGEEYEDPTTGVVAGEDALRAEWVGCPMVKGEAIYVGACLDLQLAARSDEFDTHYFAKEYDGLEKSQNICKHLLRLRCLRHQRQILEETPERIVDPDYLELASRVDVLLEELE